LSHSLGWSRQGRSLEGGRSEYMHACQPVGRQLHLHSWQMNSAVVPHAGFSLDACTSSSTYATSRAEPRNQRPHGDLHPPNSLRKQEECHPSKNTTRCSVSWGRSRRVGGDLHRSPTHDTGC
jgi:hypothetical protein